VPEPLRIGLVTHSVNPRGGVVHALELGRALHALGHEVTLFAPAQAGQRLFRDVPHAVSLVPVGPPPKALVDLVGDRIDAVTGHLCALLRRQRFDVLHAHCGIGGNALATLAEAGMIHGFVRTVHHLDVFDEPQLDAWQHRAVRQAQQLLCVSAGWVQALRTQYGRDAALVGNGVDLARWTRRSDAHDERVVASLGLDLRAPRWLLVGGIEERKNTLRALQAFVALREDHPDAQLVVAGGASLLDHGDYARTFRAEVQRVGLEIGRDLLLTGPLPDALMPALMRQCSALVMPSLREGFGLVVLEALACGTPVVVSQRPPFTEYLDDTVAAGHALYCDPQDPASIARAMRQALTRRDALAPAVPPVCHRYGWAASARRHVAIYRAQGALARAA
jgi:glycosyltransferase-like protein